MLHWTWGSTNSNLSCVWSTCCIGLPSESLVLNFQVTPNRTVALGSSYELHHNRLNPLPFPSPSLISTCSSPGDDAWLPLWAPHDGKQIPDATWLPRNHCSYLVLLKLTRVHSWSFVPGYTSFSLERSKLAGVLAVSWLLLDSRAGPWHTSSHHKHTSLLRTLRSQSLQN